MGNEGGVKSYKLMSTLAPTPYEQKHTLWFSVAKRMAESQELKIYISIVK